MRDEGDRAASSEAPLILGLRVGANVADWLNEDMNKWDNRTGLLVGATLTCDLDPYLAFQVELLWNRKGARSEHTLPGTNLHVKETVRLDYVEIPILLRFPAQPCIRSGVFAVAGKYIAYCTRAERDQRVTGTSEHDGEIDLDRTSNIGWGVEYFDSGVILGGGIVLSDGPRRYMIDIRYSLGLLTSADYLGGGFSWSVRGAKNRALQLSVCITFPARSLFGG